MAKKQREEAKDSPLTVLSDFGRDYSRHAKKLVVMRGLPFTGKSYRANELLQKFRTETETNDGVIFSTDEYFYKVNHPEKPEEYSFNPRFLGAAHKWNQLRAHRQIDLGHPLILIDNTCTTAAEGKAYVEYAQYQDYEFQIEEPTSDRWLEIREFLYRKRDNKKALKEWAEKLAEGSKETHNVPAWSIEKMMWRWQCDITVDDILNSNPYSEGLQ